MRTLLLVSTFALALGGMQTRPAPAFDPAGKWTYATQDDQGSQAAGTMTITGKPGAYTGSIVTGQGQQLPITDVYTSANGMVVLATMPDKGGTAVVRVVSKPDGRIEAGWAPVRTVIPATIARAK